MDQCEHALKVTYAYYTLALYVFCATQRIEVASRWTNTNNNNNNNDSKLIGFVQNFLTTERTEERFSSNWKISESGNCDKPFFSLHFLVCSDGLEGSNQYALNSHY